MELLNILLVEDNEGDALLTKEALQEAGLPYELIVIIDGEAAVDYLTKKGEYASVQYPNLIFLDINLPKKNGLEVLEFIKNDNDLKHIPVIMLTTSSYQNDINYCYKNHANSYITKCVEINEFMDCINKVINYWANIVKLPNISSISEVK